MKKQDFIVLGLLVGGIILGYFYDFEIFKMLYFPHDFVGLVINDYANLLAYALAFFAFVGVGLNETNLIKKTLFETMAIFLVIAVGFMTHLTLDFELVDTMSFSFLFAYLIYLFVHRVKRFKTKTFYKWFMFVSISFVLLMLVPNVLKTFILRFRPYMYVGGCLDYSFYLKWLPFNFEENFRSFPSFHVSMSSLFFVFVVYPMQSEKSRNLNFYRAVLWIGIVGYYRIVFGQHFLSDVLVSVLIGYFILRWTYFKILK